MRLTRSSAELRTLTGVGLLVAVGAVLGIVESAFVPPLPVPGVRLGLANLAVVLALALYGRAAAARVAGLRVLIVALATGTVAGPGFLLAAAGAAAAWAVMAALASVRSVTPLGWSVAGAAAYVIAQLAVACALTGSPAAMLFAPLSLALALPCGLAIGRVSNLLLHRLPLAEASVRA